MPLIQESRVIPGVKLVALRPHGDERGRFTEIFRKEWFPERAWAAVQSNRSDSAGGVLRGLHYHFRQVDYWYLARGRIRAGLADLRAGRATFGAHELIELSEGQPMGLFIPVGVAHGFLALAESSLLYVVDNYYDGDDEHGVAWNDPELGVAWGCADPIVSPRDLANPYLRDIPAEKLPRD
ncbi:MAG: dTDP-4-dehydrorhamnose 3,5-epimerase family protein [Candidatus Promineifilaceae bacterium]